MTDRAPSGGTLPAACPFLALDDDRDRRSAVPDGRHRCFAESSPQPRALTYQESYCLSATFPACRSFLDWAARAAAEPTRPETRPNVPGAPLMPLPGGTTVPLSPVVPAPAPGAAGPGSRLPPPPSGYAPPPAWQPPGTAGQEAPAYTWATPPPWVAEPELKSTAALPPTARPPLDAERSGWAAGPAPSPVPWADVAPDAAHESGGGAWAAPPPAAGVTGTFASRRLVERPPRPPAPMLAADVAPPPVMEPERAIEAPPDAHPLPADALPADGAPTDGHPPQAWEVAHAGSWSAEPVAIPIDGGVDRPEPPVVGPTQSSAGPIPGVPPADPWEGLSPDGSPPPPPPPGPAGRRAASRWLPSFLSRDDPPEAPADRPGDDPAIGHSAAATAVEPWMPTAAGWVDPATEVDAGPDVWADAAAVPWDPDADAARWADPALGVEEGAAQDPSAPLGVAAEPEDATPLVPSRRRGRGGVKFDSKAPASVGAQTSAATRTAGSGEWNRSRRGQPRSGWRRILPGIVPPVALGAIVLFLAAAFLFFMPGFFAGGGATPAPTLSAASLAPGTTPGPGSTEDPDATPAPGSTFRLYVVDNGDTLIDIARRFAVSQEVLICTNRELRRNPNLLTVGQKLQIPPSDFACPRRNPTPRPTKAP